MTLDNAVRAAEHQTIFNRAQWHLYYVEVSIIKMLAVIFLPFNFDLGAAKEYPDYKKSKEMK